MGSPSLILGLIIAGLALTVAVILGLVGGLDADQSFTGTTADTCNAAPVQFRRDIMAVMDLWAQDAHVPPPPAQEHQWALNIET
jgi:hypothetical protein